ncbi:MAG: UDP-N-acetylmuramate dehydrogenase [Clostridia bacterium]
MNTLERKIEDLSSALAFATILRDEPMSNHTSFKIGGRAALFMLPKSADEIARAIRLAEEYDVPCHIIGNGSNLLICDEAISALFIQIGDRMSEIRFSENIVTAGAGTLLTLISKRSVSMGLMGLEWANGIPGSVGGAVAMNAGAYGGEIKNVLRYVTVIQNGELKRIRVLENDLGYRKSAFAYPNAIVIEADFALDADDGTALLKMNDYKEQRCKKQPLAYPSAGSVFKRPKGRFAGELIEKSGLKGASVGGAEVSSLHAGFILNTGNATAKDVLSLIDMIIKRVYENFGIILETEIRIISNN